MHLPMGWHDEPLFQREFAGHIAGDRIDCGTTSSRQAIFQQAGTFIAHDNISIPFDSEPFGAVGWSWLRRRFDRGPIRCRRHDGSPNFHR